MARHFVRLKLALVRNGLRGGTQRVVGFVVGIAFAVPLALFAFVALASARVANDHDARNAVVMFFALLFVGWITLPIMGFGSDETLDPGRLALLPLTRRRLMTGLLTASLVGIAPLATLVALTGALIGFSVSPVAVVVSAVGVALELALCLAGSRAVVTALSRLLRSRRGRDASITILGVVGVLFQFLRFLAVPSGAGRDEIDTLVGWLQWTPPGLVGRALSSARTGDVGAALLALMVAAAGVALLLWWWSVSLRRLETRPDAQSTPARHNRERPSLFPRGFSFLPRNRVGVVAAKELRYAARDPRRRAMVIPSLVLPLIWLVEPLQEGRPISPQLTLLALFGLLASSQFVLNQFGFDGSAYWLNVAAGNDPQSDITGKNLAALVTTVPIIALSAVIIAAFSHGWAYVALVIALTPGALGVFLGVGNVVSVRLPQPIPDTRSAWGQNTGQGCTTGLLAMVSLFAAMVLLVPIIVGVLIAITVAPVALIAVVPMALAYGYAIWWLGRRSAVRWVWWRQPELLDAIGLHQAA